MGNTVLDMEEVITQSFTQYSGAVIQSRAVVDARDCIKPSARQIYYTLFTDKFVADKPFKKTLKAIGSAMRLYIHGDSSCEGIIMRSGQPFAMRYPLIEIEGSYGTLQESGNWAASRYTSSRLSEISNYLLKETNIHTVDEWADNYDDTEKYPRILSSLGFYNIVNGAYGIAVGLGMSIPQFNLKEVNAAMITLLKDPDAKFEDIACLPDFATGATLINKNEVLKSLEKGAGKACVLRATIDYDKKDNALVVRDLPYGVYTNTVCNKIEEFVKKNEDIGIININDLTGKDVCIKIYLAKNVNPERIKEILYAETPLESSYGINMTMLKDGRFPQVYGWKEALLTHLEHERKVYINLYNFELSKLKKRLNIVEGILIAINNIEEVISIIKNEKNAKTVLMERFNLNIEQVEAILEIKLARLAKLETEKFIQEKNSLVQRIAQLETILGSDSLLTEEMIKRLQEVSDKFGDERRTKVEDICGTSVGKRSTATKANRIVEDVVVSVTEDGYIKSVPVASWRTMRDMYHQKTTTEDMLLVFTTLGQLYRLPVKQIKKCGSTDKGTAAGAIFQFAQGERILAVELVNKNRLATKMIFATKSGMIKKSEPIEYYGNTKNLKGVTAMKLKPKDSVVDIIFFEPESVINLKTKNGYGLSIKTEDINFQGKSAGGVIGIKLSDDDYVEEFTVGKAKYKVQKRGTKGSIYK